MVYLQLYIYIFVVYIFVAYVFLCLRLSAVFNHIAGITLLCLTSHTARCFPDSQTTPLLLLLHRPPSCAYYAHMVRCLPSY